MSRRLRGAAQQRPDVQADPRDQAADQRDEQQRVDRGEPGGARTRRSRRAGRGRGRASGGARCKGRPASGRCCAGEGASRERRRARAGRAGATRCACSSAAASARTKGASRRRRPPGTGRSLGSCGWRREQLRCVEPGHGAHSGVSLKPGRCARSWMIRWFHSPVTSSTPGHDEQQAADDHHGARMATHGGERAQPGSQTDGDEQERHAQPDAVGGRERRTAPGRRAVEGQALDRGQGRAEARRPADPEERPEDGRARRGHEPAASAPSTPGWPP